MPKIFLKKKHHDLAISFLSETGFEESITWKIFMKKFVNFLLTLKTLDLKKGDRVAAYVPNKIESIISFLACAKNGIIWSSCSPDLELKELLIDLNKLNQVLITSDHYFYNGKKINILEKIKIF